MGNKVVIATANGDQLLKVGFDESGKGTRTAQRPQQPSGGTPFPRVAGGEEDVGVIESRIKRSEVESRLSENDYLMKQVRIYPYTEGELAAGFCISNIRTGNVLLEIGLRLVYGIIGPKVVHFTQWVPCTKERWMKAWEGVPPNLAQDDLPKRIIRTEPSSYSSHPYT